MNNNITLQTDDQKRKREAHKAIMFARLRRGCISEDFTNAARNDAVGTDEQIAKLREKWGLV